jgi:hypothetical protein
MLAADSTRSAKIAVDGKHFGHPNQTGRFRRRKSTAAASDLSEAAAKSGNDTAVARSEATTRQ